MIPIKHCSSDDTCIIAYP